MTVTLAGTFITAMAFGYLCDIDRELISPITWHCLPSVIAAHLLEMQLFPSAQAGFSALDEPPYDTCTRVSAKRLSGNHIVQ